MYIIFGRTHFNKLCLKLIHDTVVFELFRSCTILNPSHCFTVFNLCSNFHRTFVFGTETNRLCRFFWPLTKSGTKHLDNEKIQLYNAQYKNWYINVYMNIIIHFFGTQWREIIIMFKYLHLKLNGVVCQVYMYKCVHKGASLYRYTMFGCIYPKYNLQHFKVSFKHT